VSTSELADEFEKDMGVLVRYKPRNAAYYASVLVEVKGGAQ
jgi:hypothetical protein